MKKFFIGLGVSIVLVFILQFFTGWWTLPLIVGLIAMFLRLPIWQAIVVGVVTGFLIWGAYAYWIDAQNGGQLSARIGQLFNGLSSGNIILLTALIGGIGGLLGGFIGGAIAAITRPTVLK